MSSDQIALALQLVKVCRHQTHSDPYSLIKITQRRHMDLWVSSLSQESVWWWRFIVSQGQDLQSSPPVLCRAPGQQLSEYTPLCVFIQEKRQVKPTLTVMFLLGGRHSVDIIILLFCPFVPKSRERVNPVGWDVTSPGWRGSNNLLGMIQHYWPLEWTYVYVCKCYRQNIPPLGLYVGYPLF